MCLGRSVAVDVITVATTCGRPEKLHAPICRCTREILRHLDSRKDTRRDPQNRTLHVRWHFLQGGLSQSTRRDRPGPVIGIVRKVRIEIYRLRDDGLEPSHDALLGSFKDLLGGFPATAHGG